MIGNGRQWTYFGKMAIGVLLLPAFFPYVGIFSGVDMQPIGLLTMITILALTIICRPIRVQPTHLYLLIVTVVVAVARLTYQFLVGEMSADASISLLAFAQTMFHLTTILVAYLIVGSGVFVPTSKFIGLVALVYISIAVFQVLIDEQIGSELVYRGYQELEETGRGVRSLASEPSVFGNLILILSGFGMLIAARDGWPAKWFLISQVVFLASTVLLAQSSYAIAVQFVVFLASTLVISLRLFLVLCLLTMWVIIGFLVGIEAEGIRALFILQSLVQNPILLYEQGAILRVMNVPVSLYGGVLHGVFGAGFGSGNSVSGSIPALPGYPIPFEVGDRNVGGLVELFLRLGIGAVPLLSLYLQQILRISRVAVRLGADQIRLGVPLAFVIFLTSFTYSSIGNPMVWLLFFSVLAWISSLQRDSRPRNLWQSA